VLRQWPSSKHPIARRQRLEVAIGFVGFFTVIAFANAVAAELRGGSGLVEVLILLFFLIILGLTIRSWRRSGP
jgi:uncharacterized membrane protein YedE/YeeE